jgi:GNAT superfamily N-acetyltransferase
LIAAKRPALTPDVKLHAPDEAPDEGLIGKVVRLINGAYAVGEAGLWQEGASRIQPREIAAAIRSRGLLGARVEGRLVGCAYVRQLDAGTADLGLISTATDYWGCGIGRELVRSAEELPTAGAGPARRGGTGGGLMMRSRGVTTMQLELLVPKGWVHPEKNKLQAWYMRLGYRVSALSSAATQPAYIRGRSPSKGERQCLHVVAVKSPRSPRPQP